MSQPTSFIKGLGLTSATMIVMGSMIGSGIFIVSADMARVLNSPALLLLAWLITAFMTVVGALMYGELAAMMPKAGGQYVFLRESFGPLWGFLYGWTLFMCIQTGTVAAVAVAFGKFLGVFFPSVSANEWIWFMGKVPIVHLGPMELGGMNIGINTQNLIAIVTIVLLTVVNFFGVKTGALVQNIFTFAKTAALIGLILLGLAFGFHTEAMELNFSDFWRNFSFSAQFPVQAGASGTTEMVGIFAALAIVQVGSLFSADAWNNVTFAAAEVKNPQRNLPLALGIGAGSVVLMYVLANIAYLFVLPIQGDPQGATVFARGIQYAASDRVGTAVLEQIFHDAGAKLMAAAILISTFGCVNGMLLSGARVLYAMSEDKLFFKGAGELHPKYKTPIFSLVMQGFWAVVLCLSGTYGQLLDFTIFTAVLFYILTISGLFVLRKKKPNAPRPYRAVGYPWLPAIYIAMSTWIAIILLRYKPQYTWPGLILVIMGIPVYWWGWIKQNQRSRKKA